MLKSMGKSKKCIFWICLLYTSACFQMEGKQGAAICFLQDTIMSNGRLSVLEIHNPHDGGVGLPSQRLSLIHI